MRGVGLAYLARTGFSVDEERKQQHQLELGSFFKGKGVVERFMSPRPLLLETTSCTAAGTNVYNTEMEILNTHISRTHQLKCSQRPAASKKYNAKKKTYMACMTLVIIFHVILYVILYRK